MKQPTKTITKAVEEYQCPGCVCGMDTTCYEKGDNQQCGKHVPGTTIFPVIGKVFLGMPVGFDRIGPFEAMQINLFENFTDGWGYNKFNVPVWKYFDDHGNTLVRGISPRTNVPFLHIFIGDQMGRIDCLEITSKDIEGMD